MSVDQNVLKARDLIQQAVDLLSNDSRAVPSGTDRYARVRAEHPNVGKPWTQQQDEELAGLFTGGTTPQDLVLFFGRTRNAIRIRLEHLHLVDSEKSDAA